VGALKLGDMAATAEGRVWGKMPNLLRWVLVPISGVLVFYLVLFLGILCLDLVGDFCPPEEVVSGLCTAWWYDAAYHALVLGGSFIVVAGVVIVPGRVAPAHKLRVAAIAYLLGATFALHSAADAGLWAECLASAIGGTLGLGSAYKIWRTEPQPPQQRS